MTDAYGWTYSRVPPDPNSPPRIYEIFRDGNFIIWDSEAAAGLAARGFVMSAFIPTEEERAYLVELNPKMGSPMLWKSQCNFTQWDLQDGEVACSAVRPPNATERPTHSSGRGGGVPWGTPGGRIAGGGAKKLWWLALGIFGAGAITRAARQSDPDAPF